MKTKASVLSAFLILIVSAQPTVAQNQEEGRIGIGAQLFSPTGITLKADINETAAITGLTSFIIGEFNNQLTLQTNFILKSYREDIDPASGLLYLYYGGGVEFTLNENFDNRFSIRSPLGIEYEFEGSPLGIYMDIAPTIDIEPGVELYLSSSLGARFYFD